MYHKNKLCIYKLQQSFHLIYRALCWNAIICTLSSCWCFVLAILLLKISSQSSLLRNIFMYHCLEFHLHKWYKLIFYGHALQRTSCEKINIFHTSFLFCKFQFSKKQISANFRKRSTTASVLFIKTRIFFYFYLQTLEFLYFHTQSLWYLGYQNVVSTESVVVLPCLMTCYQTSMFI